MLHAAMGGLLPIDPLAYNDGTTTWSGTQAFTAGSGGTHLGVTVDYAVYAPGEFQASSTLGYPADPSNGSEFVYAYQLWNNVGGHLGVTTLTVGLADALDSGAYTEGDKLPANIGIVANTGSAVVGQPSSENFSYPTGGGPASRLFGATVHRCRSATTRTY